MRSSAKVLEQAIKTDIGGGMSHRERPDANRHQTRTASTRWCVFHCMCDP